MTDDERIGDVYDKTQAELRAHYGAQEPMHYGTIIGWKIGGPDPLDGVSIFWHPSGHWHYVGFGMGELSAKETKNPAVSGWGFELTFRLRAPANVVAMGDAPSQAMRGILAAAEAAPRWPITLLNNIARYCYESRRGVGHGHYIERPGDPAGRYWGALADPVLRPVTNANGRFAWLQLVALDQAQFERLKGDAYQAFLAELAAANPLFVSTVELPTT